jgi:diacylglycerol kinase (ATP)
MFERFTLHSRLRSIRHAIEGIRLMLATQHNAWIHLVATLGVATAGTLLGLGRDEWCWVIVACVAVWTAEALNTAFELLCDVASPDFHPMVKDAKDVAAGAVLLAAFGATGIGLAVFGPHFVELARL